VYHDVTRKRPPTEPPDDETKDRVIHTRVPGSLEAELRERAEELGMSVSNLVRNVLGNAFGLVNNVVADGHAIARAARGDKKPAAPAPVSAPSIDDVIGWQPIVLGKNAVCARCNDLLPKGKDAAVGVGTQLVICPSCLKELRT
jgi:hypothetical protein